MTHAQRISGFTLLETILALALTALLVAILSIIARQWVMEWDFGRVYVSKVSTVALAEDRLLRDIRSAIPLRNQNQTLLFSADENHITFVREPDVTDGTDHLMVIDYRNDDARGVIRRVAILDRQLPLTSSQFGEPVLLLDQNYRLNFSYRYPEHLNMGMNTDPQFPEATLITITHRLTKSFEPFTINMPISIDQTCTTRPFIKACLTKEISGQDIKNSGNQVPVILPSPKATLLP